MDDRERSSDETWSDPIEVIPMRSGYDWRRYATHGPFFLCRDGRPIEVQGQHGNWWLACTFQPGPSNELQAFAAAMTDKG